MSIVVTSVAVLLAMAGAPEADMETARTAFVACVNQNAVSFLERKADRDEFSESLPLACADEKTTLLNAIVKYERSEGTSADEAKEYAQEEIDMTLEDSLNGYEDHLANGTLPSANEDASMSEEEEETVEGD